MAKKVEEKEKAKKAVIETAKAVKATSKKTKEVVENLAKKVIKPKIQEPEQVNAAKTTPADKPKKSPKAAKPEVKEKPDKKQLPDVEHKKAEKASKKEKVVLKEPDPVPTPVFKHTSRRGRKPKSAGGSGAKSTPPKSFMNQPSKYMSDQTAAPKPEEIVPPKGLMPGRSTRYSAEDLDFFKKIIIEKKDEIIEQIQQLKDQIADPSTGQYINENSPYSLHMAEQGTDAMEREKAHLYVQRETKFLSYLEDALKRVENGTYGLCLECIDEPQNLCPTCPLVPKERLAAVPHTQLCVPIKLRQEKKKKK